MSYVTDELNRFKSLFFTEFAKVYASDIHARQKIVKFVSSVKSMPICYWMAPDVTKQLMSLMYEDSTILRTMMAISSKFIAASESAEYTLTVLSDNIACAMKLDGDDVRQNIITESFAREMPATLIEDRQKYAGLLSRLFKKKSEVQDFLKNNKLILMLALVFVVELDVETAFE